MTKDLHLNITEKEAKAIAKDLFKMKRTPTTVAFFAVNKNEGAGAWGVGDTDEIVTMLTAFAKELPEDARYAVCAQLMETIEPEAMAEAVVSALRKKDSILTKKVLKNTIN